MPTYVCPSCGAPFNGKKCKNCAYESFTEEITHNLHVHKGEPLVVRDTGRRPVPYKDPFDCPPSPRKRENTPAKKKTGGKLVTIVVILVLIFLFAEPLLFLIMRGISMLGSRIEPTSSTEAVEEIVPAGELLYEDDLFTVIGDRSEEDADSFPIYITNHSGEDWSFSGFEILVNGYCLDEFAGFYAEVPAGTTDKSYLTVSDNGLLYANIGQIQELSFRLQCNAATSKLSGPLPDSRTTDALVLTLAEGQQEIQSTPELGELIYSDENLRLSYIGLFADSYNPDSLEDAELIFCVENLNQASTSIYSEGTLLNGEDSSVSLWAYLPGNCKTIFRVYLYGIEVDQPEDIQTLSMELSTYSDDGEDRKLGRVAIPVNP